MHSGPKALSAPSRTSRRSGGVGRRRQTAQPIRSPRAYLCTRMYSDRHGATWTPWGRRDRVRMRARDLLPRGSPARSPIWTVSSLHVAPGAFVPGAAVTVLGAGRRTWRRARGDVAADGLPRDPDDAAAPADAPLDGSAAVGRLAGRRSAVVVLATRIPRALAAGSYVVFACADATARIRESNERNNCRSAAARVVVRSAGTGAVPTAVAASPAAELTAPVPAIVVPASTPAPPDPAPVTNPAPDPTPAPAPAVDPNARPEPHPNTDARPEAPPRRRARRPLQLPRRIHRRRRPTARGPILRRSRRARPAARRRTRSRSSSGTPRSARPCASTRPPTAAALRAATVLAAAGCSRSPSRPRGRHHGGPGDGHRRRRQHLGVLGRGSSTPRTTSRRSPRRSP